MADIVEYEQVCVVNINNGHRFETYVMSGKTDGNGEICLNGAAARLVSPGDLIIIMSYAVFDQKESDGYKPTIVLVDENNRVLFEKTG